MIVLTGATGTVGRWTVAALQAAGVPFRVAARTPLKAQALGMPVVEFDWDRPATFEPAFAGAETLFLLTPVAERQAEYGTGAAAAAKRVGVRHIVRLSVIGAEAEPGIALGRLHRAAERAIEASGIAWTMLRPTSFAQNFVNYYGLDPYKNCAVYLPHGQGGASWVDARDVGEVAARVLTETGHEGKAYTLTGGEAVSTADAIAILGEALGREYEYVDVPEDAAREAMRTHGAPPWMVDGLAELHALIKHGRFNGVVPTLQQLLGKPPRSFRTYAEDLAAGRA
ncbi:MAG TPA: SDR family oxidoreductase [Gemmatimonadales bacterium]|nr:SDR family oxidoreductase [Gemmatimonadales bacterium]